MKNFSGIILLLIALFITPTLKSQEFGIKGGLNFSYMRISDVGYSNGKDARFSPNFGVTADFRLTEDWFILSGLEYTSKQTLFKAQGKRTRIDACYLQIPIRLAQKFDLPNNVRWVVFAGPYVAYGISGKTGTKREEIKTFSDDLFKRFDCGLGIGTGFEYKNLSIMGGYDHGFIDVSDNFGGKVRMQNGYVSLGFKFITQ